MQTAVYLIKHMFFSLFLLSYVHLCMLVPSIGGHGTLLGLINRYVLNSIFRFFSAFLKMFSFPFQWNSRCYVHVLFTSCNGSTNAEIFMVEALLDRRTNRK